MINAVTFQTLNRLLKTIVIPVVIIFFVRFGKLVDSLVKFIETSPAQKPEPADVFHCPVIMS